MRGIPRGDERAHVAAAPPPCAPRPRLSRLPSRRPKQLQPAEFVVVAGAGCNGMLSLAGPQSAGAGCRATAGRAAANAALSPLTPSLSRIPSPTPLHSIAHSTAFHRPLHCMCRHERRAPCCSFAPSGTKPLPSMFHRTPQFYLNKRLEINTASSQVQSASAMKRRRLAPGFRSRGGIHWMLAS